MRRLSFAVRLALPGALVAGNVAVDCEARISCEGHDDQQPRNRRVENAV
jgi:hypothetical protein